MKNYNYMNTTFSNDKRLATFITAGMEFYPQVISDAVSHFLPFIHVGDAVNTAQTVIDTAQTVGDTAQTVGDAAQTAGDVAQTVTEVAQPVVQKGIDMGKAVSNAVKTSGGLSAGLLAYISARKRHLKAVAETSRVIKQSADVPTQSALRKLAVGGGLVIAGAAGGIGTNAYMNNKAKKDQYDMMYSQQYPQDLNY